MLLGSAGSVALTTLRGLIRHHAGENVDGMSDAQADGLLNQALHTMQVWILEAFNLTMLSGTTAGINLVAGTQSYAFTTDYVTINRIEISYSGGANDYSPAQIFDLRSEKQSLQNLTGTEDRLSSLANPPVYVMQNKVVLKHPPANSVTNGIIVHYTPIQTELSDATHEPIFAEHFHKYLAILGAVDWCLPKQSAQLGSLQSQAAVGRNDLRSYYARVIETKKKGIRPKIARQGGARMYK